MRKLCFPSIPPVKHKPVDKPRTDCAKPPANPHPRFLCTCPRFTRNRCPQCSKVRKPLIRHANPHLCTKLVPVNYYYYPCIHILGLTALSGQNAKKPPRGVACSSGNTSRHQQPAGNPAQHPQRCARIWIDIGMHAPEREQHRVAAHDARPLTRCTTAQQNQPAATRATTTSTRKNWRTVPHVVGMGRATGDDGTARTVNVFMMAISSGRARRSGRAGVGIRQLS